MAVSGIKVIDSCHLEVYVVVQFYPWFNFNFLCFYFVLIYDNEYETREKRIEK